MRVKVGVFGYRVIIYVIAQGYHRDLHSFPTRRSSDLKGVRAPHFHLAGRPTYVVVGLVEHRRPAHDQAIAQAVFDQRSEEHTSELQSPDHLVCRLLLEKKNHITTAHIARPLTPIDTPT